VANRVGDEGEGWRICRAALNAERLSVGGVDCQRAQPAVPPLVGLARSRHLSGKLASDDTSVRQDIARLYARGHAVRYLSYLLMTRQEKSVLGAADASVAKVVSTDLRLEAFEYGVGLFGPEALFEDGDLCDPGSAHWWQDNFMFSRALIIGGGTNEIQRNLIAERGLSMPGRSNDNRSCSDHRYQPCRSCQLPCRCEKMFP
jgi:alkylation response protein AidB-like acyl-CoA dehydrogenase